MNDVIVLHQITRGKGATGAPNQIIRQTDREVFARVGSASMREAYAAKTIGRDVSLRVVIYRADYDGETELTHAGERYTIFRTYEDDARRDLVELYCERKAAT